MFGVIKQAIRNKTSFSTAVLALFVPFGVFLGNFANALFITFKHQSVPLFLNIAFQLAGIILGSMFYHFLVKKLNFRSEIAVTEPPVKNHKKFSFSTSVLNFFFGLAIILTLKHFLPILYRPELSAGFFAAAALSLLLVFLFVMFLITSWRIIEDNTGIKGYFKTLAGAITEGFGKFTFLMAMFLLTTISLSAGVLLYELSWGLLKSTSLSPLLSYFYRGALVCCFVAFVLIVLFKTIISVLVSMKSGEPGNPGEITAQRKFSPLPGYVLIVVFILGTIYNIIPSNSPVVKEIDSEFQSMISVAGKYRNDDRLYLCGSEYKSAYALTQAYIGYLTSQQAAKDDLSEAAKGELVAKAEQYYRTAYEFWPDGGLVYYLDAMRQVDTNPMNSISLLEKATALDPDFYDSYFMLLDLYMKNNIKDKTRSISDLLIIDQTFTQLPSINSLGSGAIKKLLEKYSQNEKLCLENITTSAIFYYENQLYKEAMDELTRLQPVIPDDLVVNYMSALTDLEIKSDNKPYTVALEASQKILKQYPGEDWAEDFATGIAMRAGNQQIMESSLQESYAKNPDNLDIAEQYAYSILKKNYDFNYTESAKQAEVIVDGIIARDPTRWFALYCKAVIELFKKDYENSLVNFERFSEILSEDPELHSIYDDFYNLYVLKYKWFMAVDTKALEVIATREVTNPFLYNYTYGAYSWRNSDYDNSEKYLKTAINLMPDLSKPYFLLGNIYFEKAGVSNLPEFYPKAEDQYRKALVIFPEDPYAWFSLGHVLKKTNRLEEALGAFQKTLTYMPSEDHATDHYGISIHSVYQIQEIKELLKSKEVK